MAMRTAKRAAILGLMTAMLLPAATANAGSSSVGTTCSGLTSADCTTVSTPWIHLSALKTAGWALYCPSSKPSNLTTRTGGDYAYTNYKKSSSWVEHPLIWLAGNTTGPTPPGESDYFTTNWALSSHCWSYAISCVGATAAAASLPPAPAAPDSDDARIIRDRRLTSRKTVFRIRCKSGTKLRRAKWAVAFDTKSAPRGVPDVKVKRKALSDKRTVRFTAYTTKKHKGKKPVIQARLHCRT